ncbi:MAG: hypothetical protein KF819_07360 [Labilithrix sp.]|nr:hypothetical protein [Labilithrix sp.]
MRPPVSRFANCESRANFRDVAVDLRLKPQDVVVALKLAAHAGEPWTQPELAKSLHMSASEVNHGLKRLEACQLYNPRERRVIRKSLEEFLVAGLRYVFPAQLGDAGKGIPTSVSGSSALSAKLLVGDDDHIVWPAKGRAARVRGRTLAPLYRTVPQAATDDPVLHEYLALTDALRVGRARERALAKEELAKRLAL